MITPSQYQEIHDFFTSKRGWDEMSKESQDRVFNRYVSLMPYGVATAKTGDPDQWIFEHVNNIAQQEIKNAIQECINHKSAQILGNFAIAAEIFSM